jgi:hypothetical protein
VGTTRKGYFATLNKIMATGFPYPKLELQSMNGEGVDVERMLSERDYLRENFPEMAYIQWCRVLQRKPNFVREPQVDHPDSVQLGRDRVSEAVKKQQNLERRAALMGLADAPHSGNDNSPVKAWKPSSLSQQSPVKSDGGTGAMGASSGVKPQQPQQGKREEESNKVDLSDAADPDNAPPAAVDENSPFNVEFVIVSGKGDPNPFEEKIIVEVSVWNHCYEC